MQAAEIVKDTYRSELKEHLEQRGTYSAYLEACALQEKLLFSGTAWSAYLKLLSKLQLPHSSLTDCKFGPTIKIPAPSDWEASQLKLLEELIQLLHPWRKGPFQLADQYIDAEWRSDLKWDRLQPLLGDLHDKRVADVGCNNGYYMFRMCPQQPRCVVGFDPSDRFYYQFDLIQRLAQRPELYFELLGIDHLSLFPDFFDLILCLGVIYHRRDPYTALQALKTSLRPGGKLIIESLTIPGEDSVALCPPDRYAKMRNVWYVPTVNCLVSWLERVGFSEIQFVTTTVVTSAEQRRTKHMTFESLEDFLDPADMSKTIEGFPAPQRSILTAVA